VTRGTPRTHGRPEWKVLDKDAFTKRARAVQYGFAASSLNGRFWQVLLKKGRFEDAEGVVSSWNLTF
jgi:hypothetical protein